jgi:hypothetical protein
MSRFDLTQKSDAVLLLDTRSLVAQERRRTADVVAHLAERPGACTFGSATTR